MEAAWCVPGSRQSCRYWAAVSKVPPLFETLPTWPGRVSSHPDSNLKSSHHDLALCLPTCPCLIASHHDFALCSSTMTLPYVSHHDLTLCPFTMTSPFALPSPTFPFSSTQIPMWVTQTQQQDSLPQSDSWQWFCLLSHQYFKDQAYKPSIRLFEDCQWKHQELEFLQCKGLH